MTYLIKQVESKKYVIIYNIGTDDELTEHYAYSDGVPCVEIKQGYTKHKDSL